MPIQILDGLPAIQLLQNENIFVLKKSQKVCSTSVRVLKLLVLNLMPKKIEAENQFFRLLSNTPLLVDVQLLRIDHRVSKNTPIAHVNNFYCTFADIQCKKFDGLIVTGAPLGLIDFDNVIFWPQIKQLLIWALQHVSSVLFICWSVQAALHILYNFPKLVRKKKLVGIYQHKLINSNILLTKGFDEVFTVPHSRFSDFPEDLIRQYTDLEILAVSEDAGVYLLISKDHRLIFVTGHPEYDLYTLSKEYYRDLELGLNPRLPEHYYPQNNPSLVPLITWRSHAYLLFTNWINHYVNHVSNR